MTDATHTTTDGPGTAGRAGGARHSYNHWWITAVLMLGFTTAGLSITVVSLAFPKIMTSLRADLDTMQWVQTGPGSHGYQGINAKA